MTTLKQGRQVKRVIEGESRMKKKNSRPEIKKKNKHRDHLRMHIESDDQGGKARASNKSSGKGKNRIKRWQHARMCRRESRKKEEV